jgi:hypothetical protein
MALARDTHAICRAAAFTLVETLVAAMVVMIAMGGLFLVGSRCMGMIARSQNISVASAILHERMQQLQTTSWEILTDSESYQDQVWTDPEDGTTENVDGLMKNATQAAAIGRLDGVVEKLRVSAYRPTASTAPVPGAITVTRNATTATLTSAASNLVDEKMVRIDLRLTWTDSRMRLPCSAGLSCVVAKK